MIEMLLEAERAMSFGLLDQAERLYRHAAEADPRNSIAVVGLARVAIERGNDQAAYGLGMAALEIDAENQAARRLVDRLTEVMRERGEAIPVAPPARAAAPAAATPSPAAATPAAAPTPSAAPSPMPPAPVPVAKDAATPATRATRPVTRRRLKRSGLLGRLFGGRS